MKLDIARETLPTIPVVATGPVFAIDLLDMAGDRTHRLLDAATRTMPRAALVLGDALSRRWLARSRNPHLDEIDEVARRLGRPGVYFFSVNYEWGCTCRVGAGAAGDCAELIRVLDWRTPGLGQNVVAAHVAGAAGSFVSLTWPGYTGVLQAMAPGRFAAAVNQAPMRPLGGGFLPLDWAMNRLRVWSVGRLPAAHLLRRVFEQAQTFADARRLLVDTPIAAPAIFSLAGLGAHEACVIERTETEASVFDGQRTAANHWSTPGWRGRGRGIDSAGRARQLAAFVDPVDVTLGWLQPPVLNPLTRLAMVASAARGRLIARGFEANGPATTTLVWQP